MVENEFAVAHQRTRAAIMRDGHPDGLTALFVGIDDIQQTKLFERSDRSPKAAPTGRDHSLDTP
jgi:hypothetical protein